MSSASIALHQVCALITQTFCVQIKIPDPGETFSSEGMKLEVQRWCLRDILDICMQFVSACKSKNSDQGMDLSQAITMGAILTVTDAIIRIEPTDQPSSLFQVISGKADSMLEMANGPPEAPEEPPEEHPGISCDGCNMKPIIGPCWRKFIDGDTEDYCQACYDKLDEDKKAELSQVDTGKGKPKQ